MVGDLAAHGEAQHCINVFDAELLGQKKILGIDAVHVFNLGGKVWSVGRTRGFAIAKEGNEDNLVILQGAMCISLGGVEAAFETGVDDCNLGVVWIEHLVG